MPSIVGTTTISGPVLESFQKKVFFVNGLWWVWYLNGAQFGWKTSATGETGSWSSFTNFGPYFSYYCDVWYDESNNKICIVHTSSSFQPTYYRQGTANADGTVTWDSALVNIGDTQGKYPRVCKDSNGYPWIACYRGSDYHGDLRVYKATTTNGSAWGAPAVLWAYNTPHKRIIIVPLTGGKMLAIRTQIGLVAQSRLFNGSSWEDAITATSSVAGNGFYDAVADGNNVHLIFLSSDYDAIYVKYTYGVGWGSEKTLESVCAACYRQPSITLKGTDRIRVYYYKTKQIIKYRDRDFGEWSAPVTISSSEVEITGLSSSYKSFSDKFAVVWKSGSSSPYNVMIETGYVVSGDGGVVIDDGVGNALTFDAIEWRERQNCKAAVRNVPLRTTGSFVDTGTWTLRNRRLYITIRFTDAEKTILQTMFNEHIEVTITAKDWTYTGWFVTKPLVYEYSKDANASEREWVVEMEFALSSFSYSP